MVTWIVLKRVFVQLAKLIPGNHKYNVWHCSVGNGACFFNLHGGGRVYWLTF